MKQLLEKYKSGEIGLEEVLETLKDFELYITTGQLYRFFHLGKGGYGSTIKESVINALEQL